jgi:hypothetical protein
LEICLLNLSCDQYLWNVSFVYNEYFSKNSFALFVTEQELLGQFSSTVEQKLYHFELKKIYERIDLTFISKETNKIRGKN